MVTRLLHSLKQEMMVVLQSAACEADTRADNKHNLKAEPKVLLDTFHVG